MQTFFKSQEKGKNSQFSIVYSKLIFLCKQMLEDVDENNAPCLDCQEAISESCLIRPNLECNYIYPSDFALN